MSEFKGTKGKWEVSEANDNSGLHYIQSSVRNALVARTCYMPLSKADALLISKAPEMLEMLKEVLAGRIRPREYQSEWELVNELIKSATEVKEDRS